MYLCKTHFEKGTCWGNIFFIRIDWVQSHPGRKAKECVGEELKSRYFKFLRWGGFLNRYITRVIITWQFYRIIPQYPYILIGIGNTNKLCNPLIVKAIINLQQTNMQPSIFTQISRIWGCQYPCWLNPYLYINRYIVVADVRKRARNT